jgi:hypothetical protein
MSLPASIPAAIIETILAHLAPIFLIGAQGNPDTARQAALHLLAGYNPRNEQELSLAADIISFSFHGLEALSQSVAPDTPVARILRLRTGAVSLSRESHRCRKKLEQLQRQDPADPPPETQPAAGSVSAQAAIQLVERAQQVVQTVKKNAQQGRYGGMTYTQALNKRMTAQRMAEKAKRRGTEYNARMNETAAEPGPADIWPNTSNLGSVQAASSPN